MTPAEIAGWIELGFEVGKEITKGILAISDATRRAEMLRKLSELEILGGELRTTLARRAADAEAAAKFGPLPPG